MLPYNQPLDFALVVAHPFLEKSLKQCCKSRQIATELTEYSNLNVAPRGQRESGPQTPDAAPGTPTKLLAAKAAW
jgi:hypothetical protein